MKKIIQWVGILVLAAVAFGCSGDDKGARKTIDGDYSGPPKGTPADADAGGSPVPSTRPPSSD